MSSPHANRIATSALIAVALAGCAGRNQAAPDTTGRLLAPAPNEETVWVRAGGMTRVHFVLTTPAGVPVTGETVSFEIVDDPGTPGVEAQGAILVTTSAVTGEDGVAEALLTVGLFTIFRLRATSGDAEAESEVVVAAGVSGSVDVAPFFPPGGRAEATATVIEVLFFDNSLCADIDPRRPPVPARTIRQLRPGDGVTRYDFVTTAVSNAVVGRARDGRGAILALGCADLPGSALIASAIVRLALPLEDISPDPVGRFAVTSRFQFWPAPAAAAAIAATWRDLGDCPLDPAQLWLDCTIDALAGNAPADPLDCLPAAQPGGEGALGDALAARRGTFLAGADGQPTACRGTRAVGGATSADAVLMGLFGSPLPQAVVQLGAIADDAGHLLDALTVRSELDVRPSGRDGVYQVTHTLGNVVFGSPVALKEVPLLSLGLPALVAVTTATVRDDDALVVADHGLTFRLGSAARVAFGTLGLARRALPGDAAGFVAALTGLARSGDGAQAGCVALDQALCAQVGRPAGCLQAACEAGAAALAQKLDAAFDVADGTGLDLYLSGLGPLLDPHGNGSADLIGDPEAAPPLLGTWSADLRMQSGRIVTTGAWQAVRSGN